MNSRTAKKKMNLKEKSQLKWGYFFIAPAIIGLICFSFGPMLFSLGISFTKWDVITAKEFIGLDNYKALFHDPLFFKSLKVTLYYTLLSVPLITCVPLLIAMLLNTKVKGISIFRAIFYVPSIVPIVASAAVWMYIYNPMYGLLNSILKALGLHTHNFIFSETGAVPSLAVMALWAAGNTVVIYLAGLQGVSRQLYEAAEIDGAGAAARFFHITVPMMTPIIFYNFVMAIINSMQIFTQAYIMTDGGPANATFFYSLMVYRTAFKQSRMGYSAAMSWIFFIIIAVLTLLVFKSQKKWVVYENGD
ncbi:MULTISPECIES: carbohydrate ABC transporter permease [Blautia]|uniref:carbohydrate ABC transporter permease n=1 Tax=Blautia TaxID=572511 RepID=UPI00142D8247|nr:MULTISPECIES: sugar ABC transporter permease [Blautia]